MLTDVALRLESSCVFLRTGWAATLSARGQAYLPPSGPAPPIDGRSDESDGGAMVRDNEKESHEVAT
ncbi:hypothetical protein N7457_006275 [Penicillium paradoxum]|uniref:uncharacterized protein n=1 Tax=Penicillium paradoxum TaxID=176176 RepID=UPI002549449E|nr:uncharacterized protein N7457_006275 [Penicillium paradoxum]KAJ5781115.1 hypothetical protein N7457_006275 [Penicillium paradoxum]